MTEPVTRQISVGQSPLEYALEMLQRAVAFSCLILGISYWVRLLGFFEGPAWRFDLMPLHWQAAAVPLAVLFPFAAVGLWMLASWGPVIWFLCAAAEIVMHGLFPHLYGSRPWLIVLHLAVGATYTALRVLLSLSQRRSAN